MTCWPPLPNAAETHLMGVGAVVRGGKNQYQDPDACVPTGAGESGMGSGRAAILARVKVLRATLSWGHIL